MDSVESGRSVASPRCSNSSVVADRARQELSCHRSRPLGHRLL